MQETHAPSSTRGFLSGQVLKIPIYVVRKKRLVTEIHNGIPFSGRAGKLWIFWAFDSYKGKVSTYERVRSDLYKWREKKKEMGNYTKSLIERHSGECGHGHVIWIRENTPERLIRFTLGNIRPFNVLTETNKKITDSNGHYRKQPFKNLKDMQSAEFTWSEKKNYHVFPTFIQAPTIFYIGVYLEAYFQED